jgi:hypothetical protein
MEATAEMVKWVHDNIEAEDLTLKFEYKFDLSIDEAEEILDAILEAA